MRKLLFLLSFSIAAHAASFSYVQSNSTISANSLAFSSSNASGSMIVAAVSGFNQNLASGVSDTNSNSYTKVADGGAIITGHFQVWVATGIASGANTLSFTGMSTSNTNIIIVEYAVPTSFSYALEPLFANSYSGALTFSFPAAVIGSPTLPTEVMVIAIAYDFAQYRAWTISNGTVRQFTHEADGATMALGDYDVASPGGAVSTALTATGGSGDNYVGVAVQPALFGGSSNPVGYVFQ